MACFLVPTTEALVTTVITKVREKKESRQEDSKKEISGMSFTAKLHWLNRLLAGGSVLLAFEHLWHGEVTPGFPFLTAAANAEDAAAMLREMGTAGVTMALLITGVWAGMCFAADAIVKADRKEEKGKA